MGVVSTTGAAASAGANERALAEVRRALELRADWEMAALLHAQLLSRESPAEALSFMQGFVERNPKALDMRLYLARALIGEKRYGEARSHFDHLLAAYPERAEVLYPAAILALQQDDRTLAEARLKHLVTLDIPDKSLAYYYLGQIAEEDKRSADALAYYALVGTGEHYLPAQLRSAHLLAGQGQLDAARKQLGKAKAGTPEERLQLLIAEAALLRRPDRRRRRSICWTRHWPASPSNPNCFMNLRYLLKNSDAWTCSKAACASSSNCARRALRPTTPWDIPSPNAIFACLKRAS